MTHGRFDNPVEAVLAGLKDIFRRRDSRHLLGPEDRLAGKTVMITGANSGLGYAVALELARRGARVIMACRSGIPEAGARIRQLSGNEQVEMLKVDLCDLRSIDAFCSEVKGRQLEIDVMICNAGVAPPKARKTPQGLDEIFMVNYLAKFILLNQLLRQGSIPNDTFAGNGRAEQAARIVFVSSDSHQTASAIDFEAFGKYEDYGVSKAIANYSYYKLMMNTFATELSRRLSRGEVPDVEVHAICPGPVNSNIARDAPPLLKAFINSMFFLFFQSPRKAARPVCYLACSPALQGQTNLYFHLTRIKKMDPKVYDEAAGKLLWERSQQLWQELMQRL